MNKTPSTPLSSPSLPLARYSGRGQGEGLRLSPSPLVGEGRQESPTTPPVASSLNPEPRTPNPLLFLLLCASVPLWFTSQSLAQQVSLKPSIAGLTGNHIAYYDYNDFIGNWTDPKATVNWTLIADEDASPNVQLLFSCAPSNGGSFELLIGDKIKLPGQTQSTGSWDTYKPLDLGSIKLPKGTYHILLRATKTKGAPMNVRAINFSPLKGSAQTFAVPRTVTPLPPTYVVPNFHPASCGWLTNWSTERNYCANSYLNHLDRVRDDPNYSFVLSECNNLIAILNFKPDRFEELKARLKEGRVELVNAFFLEPTISLSGGEALAKMGVEGLRWQQQVLGVRPRTCWAIDICGTHDQMPQICALLGLDAFQYHRCARCPKTIFYSQSPDGSKIVTYAPGGYSDLPQLFDADKLTTKDLGNVEKNLLGKVSRTPAGLPLLALGGKGDYNLAPRRKADPSDFLRQWKTYRPDTEIRFTTFSQYLDATLPDIRSGKVEIPTIPAGTGYTFDSFWIENPRVKTWYRRDEHALQSAETLATIASLKASFDYPVQPLYHAWLQMLLNMDRNTLWGSAGGMVFEHETSWDVKDRFEWVEKQSAATLESAAQKLAGPGPAATLFNSANWNRSDPLLLKLPPGQSLASATCEDAGNGLTFCKLPLPSTGILSADLLPQPPATPKSIDLPPTIETPFYSARIDPNTGALFSLKSKPSGKELLSAPANVIVAEKYTGHGDPGDFVNPRPQRPRLATSSDTQSQIRVTEGPLTITVTATSTFLNIPSTRLTRFFKDDPRIEFETDLTDIPNLTVVVAEFPLAQTPSEIRRGIPFGFAHSAWPDDNPALPGYNKGITPALRYVDYTLPAGGGVALLDRGLTGREINNQTPVIYLYNATDKYYGYPNAWLSGKGPHHFEYALLPHDAPWATARIPHQAWQYNAPVSLATSCAKAESQSFLQTSDNLIVEVIRREENHIEIRLAECLGVAGTASLTLNLPHSAAALTDLTGQHPQPLPPGPSYSFPVKPQQIITLRLQTASPLPPIQPLLNWAPLVPPTKLEMLNKYQPQVVGHPPKGK